MKESQFVVEALEAAKDVLTPPLSIERGAALLYEVTVDNRLELRVDPKAPKRGQSAFQTDLCVFEEKEPGVKIPRVVLEFKTRITTHDVITYSSKARRHKQVYPYLRYGLVMGRQAHIPDRVFKHNEALDFLVAAEAFATNRLHEIVSSTLKEEITASRLLERIATKDCKPHVFRTQIVLEEGAGTIS